MTIKDTPTPYRTDNILLSDNAYYKFIFKKTEKICCVVFYILEHTDKGHKSTVAENVLESAKRMLDAVLATLSCQWYAAHDELFALLHALFACESNVRVAQAVALIQGNIADTLSLEIETVIRSLRPYLAAEMSGMSEDLFSLVETYEYPSASSAERKRNASPQKSARANTQKNIREMSSITAWQEVGPPQTPSTVGASVARGISPESLRSKGRNKRQNIECRRSIKDILSSKRQATVKDISEKITGLSEKTLYRELMYMVNEGSVIKEGEKRWSRYSLVPGA